MNLFLTFDDFPYLTPDPKNWPIQKTTELILEALNKNKVKDAIAFINAVKLEGSDGHLNNLQNWCNHGQLIGDHTYRHIQLHEVGIDNFFLDLQVSRKFLSEHVPENANLPVLRYPALDEPVNEEERIKCASELRKLGLVESFVSILTNDYIFNNYFNVGIQEDSLKLMDMAKKNFLDELRNRLDGFLYYCDQENLNKIQHSAMFHFSPLVASSMDEILTIFSERGCNFISFKEFDSSKNLKPREYLQIRLGYVYKSFKKFFIDVNNV